MESERNSTGDPICPHCKRRFMTGAVGTHYRLKDSIFPIPGQMQVYICLVCHDIYPITLN